MPTLAAGSNPARARGFTLLELLVVISIIALATAGVGLALRDSGQTLLERDAARLAAALEAGRAQSRASGTPVQWRAISGGYQFEGLPNRPAPVPWMDAGTTAVGQALLTLGPEPLIGPQQVVLVHASRPDQTLRVATDGLRPFSVEAQP